MDLVTKLWIRENIRERLYAYCRAIDQKNWDALRLCFGEGHKHEHGTYKGDTDGFVEFAQSALSVYQFTQHSLSNIVIEITDDGLSAKSECNFSAVHRIEKTEDSPAKDMFVEGKYCDDLVCVDDNWLLIDRFGENSWVRIDVVQDN